jgi:hypothetical protein
VLCLAWVAAGVAAGGKVGSLVSRLHQSPNDARHLRENQDMVVKALQVITCHDTPALLAVDS